MRPIRPGERGPAVEDIQRRLLSLGYDLGPSGVDGVFLGRTAEAVSLFQSREGIADDAVVGEETWAALVDRTFTLGDRVLYLKLPHFHGQDVHVLQEALSSLGFACGDLDGILGAYTEGAILEFQRNTGLPADGIAGDDTFRAIRSLRHVWEGKDSGAHSAAVAGPARAAAVLARVRFAVGGVDAMGRDIAERVVNLARATTPDALVELLAGDEEVDSGVALVLRVRESGMMSAEAGTPVVVFRDDDRLASRLVTAAESSPEAPAEVVLEVSLTRSCGEHELQRTAVRLLDALCVVFD